jgi:hypothetical protein
LPVQPTAATTATSAEGDVCSIFQGGLRGGSTNQPNRVVERSRFAVETLKTIRSVVTSRFPLILRLSQSKPKDFSARLAETPEALERWLDVLVDAVIPRRYRVRHSPRCHRYVPR